MIVSVSRDEFNIGGELEAVHIPSVETFVKKIRGLQDQGIPFPDQLVVRNDFLSIAGFSNATLS